MAFFFEQIFVYYLNIFPVKNKPSATAGPIPKANNKVPIPTVPPKNHPILTALISKRALTAAIGRLVFF